MLEAYFNILSMKLMYVMVMSLPPWEPQCTISVNGVEDKFSFS
jgi:hypothetical protein